MPLQGIESSIAEVMSCIPFRAMETGDDETMQEQSVDMKGLLGRMPLRFHQCMVLQVERLKQALFSTWKGKEIDPHGSYGRRNRFWKGAISGGVINALSDEKRTIA